MSLARPLFWRKATDHPQDGGETGWVADGISGRYSAQKQRDGTWLLWWAHDNFIWEACATFAEAKEKAEADWQARFRRQLAIDLTGITTAPWPRDSGSDRNGEDPKGLSAEGIAERRQSRIAQP